MHAGNAHREARGLPSARGGCLERGCFKPLVFEIASTINNPQAPQVSHFQRLCGGGGMDGYRVTGRVVSVPDH